MQPQHRGFTLIELIIAVAIVGILTAIAYPSYANSVRKGKRATAQSALMDLASKEAVYLLDRRVYGSTTELSFVTPQEIVNDYSFAVTKTTSPMAFSATATPIGRQSGNGEQTLTLDQSGSRTPAATHGYWGN